MYSIQLLAGLGWPGLVWSLKKKKEKEEKFLKDFITNNRQRERENNNSMRRIHNTKQSFYDFMDLIQGFQLQYPFLFSGSGLMHLKSYLRRLMKCSYNRQIFVVNSLTITTVIATAI